MTVYRDTQAALFWGHNLWLHGSDLAGGLGITVGADGFRRRSRTAGLAGTRFVAILPYLLAFSGHLIADRMWGFRESLFYPLGAGIWHRWMHVGEPAAMLHAYLGIIRTTPILVVFELTGAALLAWFVWDRRLWAPGQMAGFLRTGKPGDATGQPHTAVTHRRPGGGSQPPSPCQCAP